MNAVAAAGSSFLVAVLWFDLMFDVQARGPARAPVSEASLASISAYYQRVVVSAGAMSRLIPVVMAITLAAIAWEIFSGSRPKWLAWLSLVSATAGIGLATARTVRNAARLGAAAGPLETRTRLARSVLRDHLCCLAAMALVVALQLA